MNKENNNEEVLTEVTSIAEEEKKTGQKVELPDASELAERAGGAIIMDRHQLNAILPNLGKNALKRLILAALDLPTSGVPVKLVSDEEKLAYGLAQRIINNRFTVTYFHMVEKQKELKENQNKEDKETENEEVL